MEHVRAILETYWGYNEFRPLQREAIAAVVEGRDSLVVLPTGGGKSLCFQAPALAMPGLAVVVSPLISLMKDQVDALVDCGVPAACVNSTLDFDQRRRVADEIRSGRLKLLYLSPERLLTESTLAFLSHTPVSFVAIDEAHCISDWGHDFRPEYRGLKELKTLLPGVAIHAYTATATERVRGDIVRQLGLERPEVLVGSFDRPNLCFRVERRGDLWRQIRAVLDRHAGESGIIYCIRRTDVDELSETLSQAGFEALPYHAGLSDQQRRDHQDAFINDRARIIVATVAFGMGIDKPDVRFVMHAGAPKSLEAYQQESGRAGRDGLEAECCLFYSPGDFMTWRKLQQNLPEEALEAAMTNLAAIERYCSTVKCRHQALLRHFGQTDHPGACSACDVCLGELAFVDSPLILGQKIGSCVLRLKENFGGEYTAQVLVGSRNQRILERGHEQLSTWGILKEHDKRQVRAWIDQLLEQGFLQQHGEYSVLRVTDAGRRMLRGELSPQLLKPVETSRRASRAAVDSWEGVDMELFAALRSWRRQKALERGVPPYVVFTDVSLRDLARRRPSSHDELLKIHGIGERKRAAYGDEALRLIADFCQAAGLVQDQPTQAAAPGPALHGESASPASRGPRAPSAAAQAAAKLFAEGLSIDAVAQRLERSRSTVAGYLVDYVRRHEVSDPSAWIEPSVYAKIAGAAATTGTERLKPIFEALDGAVDYETIRVAVACLASAEPSQFDEPV